MPEKAEAKDKSEPLDKPLPFKKDEESGELEIKIPIENTSPKAKKAKSEKSEDEESTDSEEKVEPEAAKAITKNATKPAKAPETAKPEAKAPAQKPTPVEDDHHHHHEHEAAKPANKKDVKVKKHKNHKKGGVSKNT